MENSALEGNLSGSSLTKGVRSSPDNSSVKGGIESFAPRRDDEPCKSELTFELDPWELLGG